MTFKLKTALPADERATTETVPVEFDAVNGTLILPFEPVLTVSIVLVPVSVPAPEVMISKVTLTPGNGTPRLLMAKTSKSLIALLPFSID